MRLFDPQDNYFRHRVINGQGYEEQRVMLESEGVDFTLYGTIDLGKYQWKP